MKRKVYKPNRHPSLSCYVKLMIVNCNLQSRENYTTGTYACTWHKIFQYLNSRNKSERTWKKLGRSSQPLVMFFVERHRIHDPQHQCMLQQPQAEMSVSISNFHPPDRQNHVRFPHQDLFLSKPLL